MAANFTILIISIMAAILFKMEAPPQGWERGQRGKTKAEIDLRDVERFNGIAEVVQNKNALERLRGARTGR